MITRFKLFHNNYNLLNPFSINFVEYFMKILKHLLERTKILKLLNEAFLKKIRFTKPLEIR